MKSLLLYRIIAFALLFVMIGCSDLGEPERLFPESKLERDTIEFSTITIGSSQTLEFYMTNQGSGDLNAKTTLVQDSSAFSISPEGQFLLGSGDTLYLELTFTPHSESDYTALLMLESNDPLNPESTIQVSGSGTPLPVPVLTLSRMEINFGTILNTDQAHELLTLSNSGMDTLLINAITFDLSAYHSNASTPLVLNPGASQTITITFQPLSAGTFNAVLSISSNTANSPHQILLQGSAENPVSYASTIQPIWNSKCGSCHGSNAGLNLSSYTQLMNGSNSGAVVIPGDGANSKIIQKLKGTSGSQMPLNATPLSANTIATIETWIDQGALNN
ncbi:MAG: choice-of-anchor D domain-containing protein [Candidatus Marinimicrobia bacterium]|nr:choice-of-anchor D domain-containing protein [Candidatus Neomarinimicrobiota bacterium]